MPFNMTIFAPLVHNFSLMCTENNGRGGIMKLLYGYSSSLFLPAAKPSGPRVVRVVVVLVVGGREQFVRAWHRLTFYPFDFTSAS